MNILFSASVIIPFSGNGYSQLIEQLDALSRQDTLDKFEIILCLNREAMDSRTLGLLQKCVYPIPFHVFLADKVKGPSYARNIGAANARSENLLFCDSDDVVSATWVSSMLKSLGNYDLVGGPLIYSGEKNSSMQLVSFQESQKKLVTKFDFLPFANSSNMGIKRDCFISLGGFNESFTTGEDTEICWRAQLAGFTLGFDESAHVFYRLRQSFKGAYSQFQSYARGDMRLVQEFDLGFHSYAHISLRLFRVLFILGFSPLAFVSGRFRRTLGCNLGYSSAILAHLFWRNRGS